MRNPAAAAKGTGSTESTMRRLQPELSGYHGNLSSGPPTPVVRTMTPLDGRDVGNGTHTSPYDLSVTTVAGTLDSKEPSSRSHFPPP
ncbi:hypothetical protein MJG53_001532 [Ovis ammon polii x Ovis aries]|uniref:Uncharacterized protein n=2 Tax=Ovis TaxID=9935 RepID=A0A836AMG2_SHEEP|nr:hypothetical protein JEQ12_001065 [Ovis aries]KAI4590483.1 hypothetical protein MJG53_001532 [Ovis ammon polii x Ovis aries]